MDHGGWRRVALGVAAALALAGCDGRAPAAQVPAASAGPAPTVSATPDEKQQRVDRATADINEQLAKQSAALLKGDRAGYVAVANTKAIGIQLGMWFDGLRGLKIAELRQAVAGAPQVSGADSFAVTVSMNYCLVVRGCGTDEVSFETGWRQTAGGLRLDRLKPTDQTRPWQTDKLISVSGKRVIVATTPDHASDARAVLPVAENAAKVADSFSVGGYKPYRYVVYLAGKKQWQRWYGRNDPYYAGVAMTHKPEATDLVVQLDGFSVGSSGELLRHEMTHLSTLGHAPIYDLDNDAWWLSEGLADLASGEDYRDSRSRREARRFISARKYRGDLQSLTPFSGDSHDDITVKYSLGWYATTCIDEKYGRGKLVALVDALLRHNVRATKAAPDVFGTDWAKVEATCFAYTRGAVGS